MKGVVILMVSIIHENVYCEPCFKYAQEVIPPDPTGKSTINFRLFDLITISNQYFLIFSVYQFILNFDVTKGFKYARAYPKSACCVLDGPHGFHDHCKCPSIKDTDQCYNLCKNQTECKGYTMSKPRDGASPTCFVFMTACPEDCRKVPMEGDWFLSSGALDPNAQCGSPDFSGCFIKNSQYYLKMSLFFIIFGT